MQPLILFMMIHITGNTHKRRLRHESNFGLYERIIIMHGHTMMNKLWKTNQVSKPPQAKNIMFIKLSYEKIK